jgi:hypothetical protein
MNGEAFPPILGQRSASSGVMRPALTIISLMTEPWGVWYSEILCYRPHSSRETVLKFSQFLADMARWEAPGAVISVERQSWQLDSLSNSSKYFAVIDSPGRIAVFMDRIIRYALFVGLPMSTTVSPCVGPDDWRPPTSGQNSRARLDTATRKLLEPGTRYRR